jgi:hypothetical protein
LRCDSLTTGSRALDEVLGLGLPSLVLVHGGKGADRSTILRAAAISYAAGCGRAMLASTGSWGDASTLGGLPQDALDRLVLVRLSDEGSVVAASRAFALLDFGLISLDNASDLLEVSRAAAPRSYISLSLSRAASRRGAQSLVSLSGGPSRIRGYDYWWPFADLIVRLDELEGPVRRASSARGAALFRISGGSISDL